MPGRESHIDAGAGRFRPRGPGAFLLGLMLLVAVPHNTFPLAATSAAFPRGSLSRVALNVAD